MTRSQDPTPSSDVRALRQVLGPVNPVPGHHAAGAADTPEARALLAGILAVPRPATGAGTRSGTPTRRIVLGAAALAAASAVVLASGVVTLPWNDTRPANGAYAATPPLLHPRALGQDPASVLTGIAGRVAGLPDDTGTGRYARVSTQGWYLSTRVGGDGHAVHSVVMPQDVTTWTAEDGSGRTRTRYQQPGHLFPTVEDDDVRAGERGLMWPLGSLSSDDSVLADQLGHGHPVSNGPAERLVAITDACREQPLPPAVRAAVLRYLAATPTLQLQGSVTDRLGRPGIAVGLDSDYSGLPTRYTLIIDPRTGRLLGEEQTLTTTAGKLDVPVPSVISYTAYRSARYSDDEG